jgi:hypothetical protein
MMGGVSPETYLAIKKYWNNKFYYTVASCWFFLWVSYTGFCAVVQFLKNCRNFLFFFFFSFFLFFFAFFNYLIIASWISATTAKWSSSYLIHAVVNKSSGFGIINSTTRSHLVGSFYEISVKPLCLNDLLWSVNNSHFSVDCYTAVCILLFFLHFSIIKLEPLCFTLSSVDDLFHLIPSTIFAFPDHLTYLFINLATCLFVPCLLFVFFRILHIHSHNCTFILHMKYLYVVFVKVI